ncbi:2'-5' RNA ligase family protein [Bosea sp. PAMC 26642]|uniref:2'-5' RNA ligase family protein n=1 Tax=Bosea sp. (strain PAMC 26642) TaxID=1792307 RepID=UPI00076FEA6B|nr:2'-5' RNA ligase family protein [Bosea sp. PAMC 26642]AMJ62416.1 hypothetical protein AXW83_20830 [Bosea sp. PAMC 26642]
MTAAIHSIWLMPCSADGAILSDIAAGLSHRFGTPLFTPHLTMKGDSDLPLPTLEAEIAQAAAETAGFSEAVAEIETGEAYFRSFYARFAVTPALAKLKQQLDGQATDVFLPHVSLLYGPVAAEQKAEAAKETARALVGRTIRFDRLCVVTSGQDIPITQWRSVAAARLG